MQQWSVLIDGKPGEPVGARYATDAAKLAVAQKPEAAIVKIKMDGYQTWVSARGLLGLPPAGAS